MRESIKVTVLHLLYKYPLKEMLNNHLYLQLNINLHKWVATNDSLPVVETPHQYNTESCEMLKATQARNTAWNFLRKNPDYISDWHHPDTTPSIKNDTNSLNIYEQHQHDLSAKKWGLFMYQDPTASPESITPFWSIAPTLDAEIVHGSLPPLLPMLRKVGAKITGLLLLNGDLVLKVEHGAMSVQVRIKDGKKFDETSGLTLHLPLDLTLPIRLTRSLDLWNFTTGQQAKKVVIQTLVIIMNFYSFSMVYFLERATAR